MLNNFRRIFLFDENSLNSNSSDTSLRTPSQSTTPIDDYSLQSSGTQGSSNGIYEDHPGLNPSSERIVELQSDIHEKLTELMPNKSAQDVMVASEALHGESNHIPFLEHLLNDLNQNRIEGEAYRDALDLAGIVPSPLEQFEIVPLIDLKIGNLYFSFTNPSFFMLLTLSLVLLLLLILLMEKEERRKKKSLEWREKRRKITFGSSSASDDSSKRKKPEEEELEKEEKKIKHYETLADGARLSLIQDIASLLPQKPHLNKVKAILGKVLGSEVSNYDRLVKLSQEVLEKGEHSDIVKQVLKKLLE